MANVAKNTKGVKTNINIKEEAYKAKVANWVRAIALIADEICEERKNDPNVMIDILNGEIYSQAQERFVELKKMGLLDSQNMPIHCNL